MKYKFSVLLILISFLSISAWSQETTVEKPVCEQPFSSKFDEFEFTDLNSAKERLDLFGLQIKNLKAQGVVIGYGGKITESNQGRSISYKIEEYLTGKFNFYKYTTISTQDGGHREKPTVELYIKPLTCSEYPEPSSLLGFDDVSYKEENSVFTEDVIRKTSSQLESLLLEQTEFKYPPAARAVRAKGKVLVLIVVDEKGRVIKAGAIDGHPLLRAASESAIRNWKYQTLKEKKKSIKYGGKVVIDWDKLWGSWVEVDN